MNYQKAGDVLIVQFVTHEDTDCIFWPALSEPKRTENLWQTTCFEVFVQTSAGYWEYNLSPSSAWASYHFEAYRSGMTPATEFVTSSGMRFEAYDALLSAQLTLPPNAISLGFSAVIETTDGKLSYWALTHPSDKPDFHHPDSFTLELP
ncbi:DOMON-like domain-containing protein [Brevundimonas sp.]